MLLVAYLGLHLKSQSCQRCDEESLAVKSTRYFCYFQDPPATIGQSQPHKLVISKTQQLYEPVTLRLYPFFNTRLASAKKSAKLVPMRDRQNTAMSTEPSPRGTCTGETFLEKQRTLRGYWTQRRSRWPCRRRWRARRWQSGRSCALCSSHCALFYNRRSRSLPPPEKEVCNESHETRF